jgi:hypothetical protein
VVEKRDRLEAWFARPTTAWRKGLCTFFLLRGRALPTFAHLAALMLTDDAMVAAQPSDFLGIGLRRGLFIGARNNHIRRLFRRGNRLLRGCATCL